MICHPLKRPDLPVKKAQIEPEKAKEELRPFYTNFGTGQRAFKLHICQNVFQTLNINNQTARAYTSWPYQCQTTEVCLTDPSTTTNDSEPYPLLWKRSTIARAKTLTNNTSAKQRPLKKWSICFIDDIFARHMEQPMPRLKKAFRPLIPMTNSEYS
jgi:hypothetical protein